MVQWLAYLALDFQRLQFLAFAFSSVGQETRSSIPGTRTSIFFPSFLSFLSSLLSLFSFYFPPLLGNPCASIRLMQTMPSLLELPRYSRISPFAQNLNLHNI